MYRQKKRAFKHRRTQTLTHAQWPRVAFNRKSNGTDYSASALARISCQRLGRFLASKTFLRRRIDLGVTSTNSSSEMNSMAFSKVNSRGGIRRMASSALEERMLVCFFSLVML